MRVMVVGASRSREKFGNRALRAYVRQGHEVLPVNPHAEEIEGVPAFASIDAVPGPIDRASIYLHPEDGRGALEQIAKRGDVGEVWLNPGAESPELLERAQELGLSPIVACSIMDIGERP